MEINVIPSEETLDKKVLVTITAPNYLVFCFNDKKIYFIYKNLNSPTQTIALLKSKESKNVLAIDKYVCKVLIFTRVSS